MKHIALPHPFIPIPVTPRRFLEGVKNDPWRASKFFTEAEKLEAEREEEAAALELEGLDGDNDSRLLNKVCVRERGS